MPTADNEMHYTLDPDVPFRILDGQAIIIDSRLRQVHLFNETGTRIWELLKAPCSTAAIAAKLAEEFDAERVVLQPQVQTFVDSLIEMKLAVARAAP